MAYRSSSSGTGNSALPSTTVPAGVAANDIVILVVNMEPSGTDFTGKYPTGFTELFDSQVTADGQSMCVAWKRLSGADSGSYTFSDVGNSNDWCCQAYAFSGRHTTNAPTGTFNPQNTGQSSPITVTATGVTAVEGDDILWISSPDVAGTGIGTGHTPPTNYTERQDAELGWANLSGATRDNVSAGATGSIAGTFTLASGQAGWGAYLIRIPSGVAARFAGGDFMFPMVGQ